MQHRLDVCLFYHLQVLVTGCILRTNDSSAGVIESNATRRQEVLQLLKTVVLPVSSHKVLLVAKEAPSHDTPHVVREIGIIERHGPSFLCWWKRAQHQHPGTFWQKWFEGMAFCHHHITFHTRKT